MAVGDAWSSGNWQVSEGKADEFIKRWEELAGSAKDDVAGFREAHLLRDAQDPNHFVSVANWDDAASREAWMSGSDFPAVLELAKELCDDFRGGGYDEVTTL